MTISEDAWGALTSSAGDGAGAAWSRVAPESGHDLYIAVKQPGAQRCLWYDLPAGTAPPDCQFPTLRAIRIDMRPRDDTDTLLRCELALEREDLKSVFRALANDIVGAVAATPDDEAGFRAFVGRLERWQRLLQSDRPAGLTSLERRGLFGEMEVFSALLTRGTDRAATAAAWTGPYGNHQDFQAMKAALEVKSTVTKQPQSLVIASERELDDTGVDSLFLVHLSLDERRGGTGRSLNAAADAIRDQLADHPYALAMFEDALLHCGFLPEHRALYDEPRYTIRAENAYRVGDLFPRITEAMIPTGVGDVTYRIQIAALSPHAATMDEALDAVGDQ